MFHNLWIWISLMFDKVCIIHFIHSFIIFLFMDINVTWCDMTSNACFSFLFVCSFTFSVYVCRFDSFNTGSDPFSILFCTGTIAFIYTLTAFIIMILCSLTRQMSAGFSLLQGFNQRYITDLICKKVLSFCLVAWAWHWSEETLNEIASIQLFLAALLNKSQRRIVNTTPKIKK